MKIHQIAVLMTCHNRKVKTLNSLRSLYAQKGLRTLFNLDTYLVDDGSTDGTSTKVEEIFPKVKVVFGNGDLFWNRGMYTAWESCKKSNKKYDFYFWLNDDTVLKENCIHKLLKSYEEIISKGNDGLIFGFCESFQGDKKMTYGGIKSGKKLSPNGEIQQADLINGNVVLIPNSIYEKVGTLDYNYLHVFGDYDYSLRVNEIGYNCFSSIDFVAYCDRNEPKAKGNLIARIKTLNDIFSDKDKKFRFSDFVYFRKKHFKEFVLFIKIKFALKYIFS